MKKLLILCVLLLSGSMVEAQEIKWMTMNEALAAQKKQPKKILIDFYTDWCGWCKRLDKDTYQNKEVVEYINKNFYAVKFDAEGQEKVKYKEHEFSNPNFVEGRRRNSTHQLAVAFKIKGYPNTAVLDKEANLVTAFPGYRKPKEMLTILKYLKEDIYKTTPFQEYMEKNQAKGK